MVIYIFVSITTKNLELSLYYNNDYVPVHYSHISSDILDLKEIHTHTDPKLDRHKQTVPFSLSSHSEDWCQREYQQLKSLEIQGLYAKTDSHAI